MQRRTKIWLTTTPIAVLALLMGAVPANAHSAIATANQTPNGLSIGDGYVVVNPASAEQVGNATFYPTGPISEDTVVVIPDAHGNLPDGLTKTTLKTAVAELRSQIQLNSSHGVNVAGDTPSTVALATVSRTQSVAPASRTFYSWAGTSGQYSMTYTGQSIIGINWNATARYNFDTANGYQQFAVGLGKGHYRGYNGSTFGTWTYYYNVGSSTGSGADVPWGQVIDTQGFRAMCVASSIVCFGNFWGF